jgi:nitroreductase
MDAYEVITTKRDVRSFSAKPVPSEMQTRVLEAGRLSGSGKNIQHWRFILVGERQNLRRLADDSTTGMWVAGANFAIVVLTDPKLGFHKIDAGRAAEDMQLAAWGEGVVSCIYTGIKENAMREHFDLPPDLSPTIVVGFGYPAEKVTGRRKNRKPLQELAYLEKYGDPIA